MSLRAKKLEPQTKRLKLLLFGGAGVGKSTAAASFPNSYIIDGEHGLDHYSALLAESHSVVLQTTNSDEVIDEVRALGTEKHEYRTLVIDPLTTIETDLIERCEKEFGAGDMRIWGKRDRTLRRLTNLTFNLDMNLVVTMHGKIEYGDQMKKLGTTYDGWKRLIYAVDLAIELERRGTRRVGIVRKTRLAAFPDGDVFDFSYAEIAKRYGEETMSRAAVPVAAAPAERVAKLKALVELLRLDADTVGAWLKKANVDGLDDMPAEAVEKCIEFVEKKIAAAAAGKESV